jgi:hypothetical protein
MIRQANERDVFKISRLWYLMVKEMRPDWEPNPGLWREHCFNFLKSKKYFIFIAEEGGRVQGFIDYFLFPEPSDDKIHAVGQHFYMMPECRKGKTAWWLYKIATDTAKMQGAQILELFCFEKEIKKWKRKGYTPMRYLVRQEVANV